MLGTVALSHSPPLPIGLVLVHTHQEVGEGVIGADPEVLVTGNEAVVTEVEEEAEATAMVEEVRL